MIHIEDLAVSFGDFHLSQVSLKLERGRTLAVLGPSGAGKSVLLETLMGVRVPARGRVVIDGADVSSLPPEARDIAYIPQDLALFPHMNVRENLLFGLHARGRRDDHGVLEELSSALQLEALLDRQDVATLSGGEQQRVALARALAVEPKVLFLDEPFSALDRMRRFEAVELLRGLAARLGTTIVLVTHDLEEASALADDVAILLDGRLAQHGERDEVFNRPANRRVASFLMMVNLIERADLPVQCDSPEPKSRWFGIRPEETVLLTESDGRPNCFEATVEEAVLLASRWSIRFRISTAKGSVPITASLQPGRFRVLQPTKGRELIVHLPPEAVVELHE